MALQHRVRFCEAGLQAEQFPSRFLTGQLGLADSFTSTVPVVLCSLALGQEPFVFTTKKKFEGKFLGHHRAPFNRGMESIPAANPYKWLESERLLKKKKSAKAGPGTE